MYGDAAASSPRERLLARVDADHGAAARADPRRRRGVRTRSRADRARRRRRPRRARREVADGGGGPGLRPAEAEPRRLLQRRAGAASPGTPRACECWTSGGRAAPVTAHRSRPSVADVAQHGQCARRRARRAGAGSPNARVGGGLEVDAGVSSGRPSASCTPATTFRVRTPNRRAVYLAESVGRATPRNTKFKSHHRAIDEHGVATEFPERRFQPPPPVDSDARGGPAKAKVIGDRARGRKLLARRLLAHRGCDAARSNA